MNLFIYLLIINIITAIFFIADKRIAMQKGTRVSESTLHLFELLGGIFSIILLMPIIRHKNKKKKYWIVSVLIFIIWIFFFVFYFIHF